MNRAEPERIQNYAMRIILRKPPRTSSEPLIKQLSLTSLKTRRQIATLLQVQRCLHKCAPSYLTSKFISNSNFGYSSTRGASKLHLKRPATSYYRNSFEFQGALMFNALPAEIRHIDYGLRVVCCCALFALLDSPHYQRELSKSPVNPTNV